MANTKKKSNFNYLEMDVSQSKHLVQTLAFELRSCT